MGICRWYILLTSSSVKLKCLAKGAMKSLFFIVYILLSNLKSGFFSSSCLGIANYILLFLGSKLTYFFVMLC